MPPNSSVKINIDWSIALQSISQAILRLVALGVLLGGISTSDPTHAQSDRLGFDQGVLFDQVWTLTQKHFHDPGDVEASWDQAGRQFRPQALAAETHQEFAQVINELLATLKTSHTYYFAAGNPKRNQILGIFEGLVPKNREDLFFFNSIGIEVYWITDRFFVQAVYDGSPAAEAGVMYGDEIISVDDLPYREIESFQNKEQVRLQLRRTVDDNPETLQIPVVRFDSRRMFEDAMLASARLLERNQQKIAYVHIWSYAGSKYQEHLRSLLLFGELSTADALILDLRDGWGGASLEFLNLFRDPIVNAVARPRQGEAMNFSGVWGKPIVLLVNRRTTSGKELFAFGFKKLGLGKVVGEPTAGAVVAGRGFLLSNEDVLYLAVSDIEIDGRRLEGNGVHPDDPIERPLPYAAGADPPLERAVKILTKRR